MSSYLSSVRGVLTSTTSRYNNLRKSLLNDENDGDTDDDSHISRVLRAYYVEKGRSFPPWLPADPKSSYAAPAQYAQPLRQQSQQQVPRRGGGLSDLWDTPSQQSQAQPPPSLRRNDVGSLRGNVPQVSRGETYARTPSSSDRLTPSGVRPLPSQREGSHQSQGSLRKSTEDYSLAPSISAGVSPGVGASAQDRLKARLWSGRSGGQGGSRNPMERGTTYNG